MSSTHYFDFDDSRPTSRGSTNPDLPSPGLMSEIPPALSPLDALALQGRLLAKRFEVEKKTGRRISRLAPITIQNEFGRQRPGYFRSVSEEPRSVTSAPMKEKDEEYHDDQLAHSIHETNPETRPKSQYPQYHSDGSPMPPPFPSHLAALAGSRSASPQVPQDIFPLRRTHSPDQLDARQPYQQRSIQDGYSHSQQNDNWQPAQGMDSSNLRPQRTPLPHWSPRSSPSVLSVPGEGSDVEGMSLGGSVDSFPHKLSAKSSFSGAAPSPYSPMLGGHFVPRSPSISSEYSNGGTRLRPAYNFSRPRSTQPPPEQLKPEPKPEPRPWIENPSRTSEESRYGRPSVETPPRQNSQDSATIPQDVHTPISMNSDEYTAAQDSSSNAAAPSYIYSKYSLPRGRAVGRESMDSAHLLSQFLQSDNPMKRPSPPPSPKQRDLTISQETTLALRGKSFDDASSRPRPSIGDSSSSGATIRPKTAQSIADMSPEEHLEQGIRCHEAGSLQKSTYHLRLAARAGHPTAMILYALACRHGWGMRQNEAEGFNWLKKAVESSQLELADDENPSLPNAGGDIGERRTRKARFALGIYELGKSYMEGWGIHQDRSLALRCFEIAGGWGDADALTEAGYCYAEGLGCKKDMKKAAKFYRTAADKGASMVGQSWIYKEKYMDEPDNNDDARSTRSKLRKDPSEKKPRDKSRTRTIFGRKKSSTQ